MLYTMPVALSIERWMSGAAVAASAADSARSSPVATPTPSIAVPAWPCNAGGRGGGGVQGAASATSHSLLRIPHRTLPATLHAPAFDMIALTSAKSTLISPGTVMMSEMPWRYGRAVVVGMGAGMITSEMPWGCGKAAVRGAA
eukprot:366111-Chlamydomonas_euryale.AAC.16